MDIGKGRILQKSKDLRLVAFAVTGYANNEDRKSITGGVMTMGRSPIYFTSKMQATVSLLWTGVEYIALGTVT